MNNKAILVRMDSDLHTAVTQLARAEDRSVSKFVIRLVRDELRRQARSAADRPTGGRRRHEYRMG